MPIDKDINYLPPPDKEGLGRARNASLGEAGGGGYYLLYYLELTRDLIISQPVAHNS
jgi:hypothetical protein